MRSCHLFRPSWLSASSISLGQTLNASSSSTSSDEQFGSSWGTKTRHGAAMTMLQSGSLGRTLEDTKVIPVGVRGCLRSAFCTRARERRFLHIDIYRKISLKISGKWIRSDEQVRIAIVDVVGKWAISPTQRFGFKNAAVRNCRTRVPHR
jgi:hypothetical protein